MMELSYRRHRFPPVVIQHAVWLYLRFTLSYRDVEDLLAERGLDISYETVRSWVLKFGPVIAQRLRRHRPRRRKHGRCGLGEQPADVLQLKALLAPFRLHDMLERARRPREEQRSVADRAACRVLTTGIDVTEQFVIE